MNQGTWSARTWPARVETAVAAPSPISLSLLPAQIKNIRYYLVNSILLFLSTCQHKCYDNPCCPSSNTTICWESYETVWDSIVFSILRAGIRISRVFAAGFSFCTIFLIISRFIEQLLRERERGPVPGCDSVSAVKSFLGLHWICLPQTQSSFFPVW